MSSAVEDQFKDYYDKLKEEINELRQEVLGKDAFATPPKLHSEDSVDVLIHNKLKIESELESTLVSDLTLLPEDEDILLNLGKEQAKDTLSKTLQALEYEQEINKFLEDSRRELKVLVENAEAVQSNLDDLINNRTEKDYTASLKHKYSTYGELFRELRESLHWYLNSRFPSDDDESLSMESVLERLTKQLSEDPNDPYIKLESDVKEEHISALIGANLIIRHAQDPSKYRLVDFRRN